VQHPPEVEVRLLFRVDQPMIQMGAVRYRVSRQMEAVSAGVEEEFGAGLSPVSTFRQFSKVDVPRIVALLNNSRNPL
jgi:hypothetical protein